VPETLCCRMQFYWLKLCDRNILYRAIRSGWSLRLVGIEDGFFYRRTHWTIPEFVRTARALHFYLLLLVLQHIEYIFYITAGIRAYSMHYASILFHRFSASPSVRLSRRALSHTSTRECAGISHFATKIQDALHFECPPFNTRTLSVSLKPVESSTKRFFH
jgi:transposase